MENNSVFPKYSRNISIQPGFDPKKSNFQFRSATANLIIFNSAVTLPISLTARHFWYENQIFSFLKLIINIINNDKYNKLIKFKDVLDDGNAEEATLSSLIPPIQSHTVLIYSYENYKFKIKDSYGEKYEIPIDRPDFIQVFEK